jgi:hypothetical protein
MDKNELFEIEDLEAVFQECGIEAERSERETNGKAYVCYTCQKDDLIFGCCIFGNEQFPQLRLVSAIPNDGSDLFEKANFANSDCVVARVYVDTADSDDEDSGQGGPPFLTAHYSIYVGGGISTLHVGMHLIFWCKDLDDLFHAGDSDNEELKDMPVIDCHVEGMDTVDQLEWILSTDSVPRTARQLAGFLMKERQEINRALYSNHDKFLSDRKQPPRWTIRSA